LPGSEVDDIVECIERLPDQGEGMTVGEIALFCGTDSSTVVGALQTIVEREERDATER
jgi:hypothetical protein